jgi:hypothetical protein
MAVMTLPLSLPSTRPSHKAMVYFVRQDFPTVGEAVAEVP